MKITLLLILIPFNLYAETGFTYVGDLNGDGVNEHIQTGPSSLFGNGGGPCVLTVSTPGGTLKKKIISCGRTGISFEKSLNKYMPSRLWHYWRIGAGQGSLSSVTLDGKFKKEGITLYLTGENSIGTNFLKVLKEKGIFLEFKEHKNYTPPEQPCGVQWGKSC